MIFDCFPFFNELDVLEIRLHELDSIVDYFLIVEAEETYGGQKKPLVFEANAARFKQFGKKIQYVSLPTLKPACTDRISGREREAYQRNALWYPLLKFSQSPSDIVIFSDCDEIPSREGVATYLDVREACGPMGVWRFAQHSFYYNVHTEVDYGHDFASRARIGTVADVVASGSMYNFRMARKNTTLSVIEEGGWHFSYFGGPERIKTKVSAMAPFLSEYKLFGDEQLVKDINARRDLHHRRCEMPEVFRHVESPVLPEYLTQNRERFPHFFKNAVAA